jgi:molybdopterin/thiamine biosynthesis adenylyltransferase
MDWRGRLSRQMDIFGEEGIRTIRNKILAVVGLGGNGSAFALLAAYLGFPKFYLVDYDRLAESNLNRFLCGGYGDIGKLKVGIFKSRLEEISPDIACIALPVDVEDAKASDALAEAHVIVSAVDGNPARVFVQERCLELQKPLLDLGSGGLIQDGKLRFLGSRASLYIPGEACLFCQTLEENDPSLSLISLVIPNAVAAACGLALLLSWLTGYGEKKNFAYYDGISNSLTSMMINRRKDCLYCRR